MTTVCRRKFIVIFYLLIVLIVINTGRVNSYSTGAPSGFAGAPATSGNTCSIPGCHFGTVQSYFDNILLNIPEEGYVPGNTYQISTFIEHPGRSAYGFQLSAQNAIGDYAGQLKSTSIETQSLKSGRYITHTEVQYDTFAQQRTWSFEWEAPEAGFGEVTFFGAYNAANGDSTPAGDIIYTSSITFTENLQTGVSYNKTITVAKVYPNPTFDIFHIILSETSCSLIIFEFFDGSGKILSRRQYNDNTAKMFSFSAQRNGLCSGRNFVKISTCNSSSRFPLIVL